MLKLRRYPLKKIRSSHLTPKLEDRTHLVMFSDTYFKKNIYIYIYISYKYIRLIKCRLLGNTPKFFSKDVIRLYW